MIAAAINVLYAEDDENDAFFMQRAFNRLGRRDELRIVNSGKQAIEYLKKNAAGDRAPGLVILDIKMPEASGLEVLAWLRSQPAFSALPVVMFTSSVQEQDVAVSRSAGANAYLVKPANAENLVPLVERLLTAATLPSGGRLEVPENLL